MRTPFEQEQEMRARIYRDRLRYARNFMIGVAVVLYSYIAAKILL